MLLCSINLSAQVDTTFSEVENLDNYLDESRISEDDSHLLDLIEHLKSNPIDINSADVTDMLKIPFMSVQTAQSIVQYRKKNGKYFSPSQLYMIPNLDKDEIANVLTFLTTSMGQDIEKDVGQTLIHLKINYRTRALNDLQTRRGFSENKYQGSSYKIYNRLKASLNGKYQLGLLSEKDPGEKDFTDFTSAHLSATDFIIFDKIILGDYLLEFGQGLVVWSPYGFGKGSDATGSAIKNNRFISEYTSTDENQFLRGGTFSISIGDFTVTPFYSKSKIDANIENDLITSLPLDGYHRTELEINKRKRLSENIFGARLEYNVFIDSKISLLYLQQNFQSKFERTEPFDLAGDQFSFYSVSYQSLLSNFFLSGEVASNGKSLAQIHNVQFQATHELSFLISIRNYPVEYRSLLASGFGESSNTRNEFGIYFSMKIKTDYGTIDAYYDQFKFPYATFDNPLPSIGNELLLAYRYRIFRGFETYVRYQFENKEITDQVDNEYKLFKRKRHKLRVEFNYTISKQLRLRSRVENVIVNLPHITENGFLIFQDIRGKLNNELDIYGRMILFNTDSYESRIYQFENDLLGVMTNPALFGKGLKWYLLLKYRLLSHFTISLKYSELIKPDAKTLGSGMSEINGNLESKVGLQVDLSF